MLFIASASDSCASGLSAPIDIAAVYDSQFVRETLECRTVALAAKNIDTEGKAKLDDLTGKIKGINLEVIIAVGHTDWIGTEQYNQKLSERRAAAVKAYLVSKGIEPNRVYTEGKGEKQPIADNKTAEGRAKNRRVEIEVVGTHGKK